MDERNKLIAYKVIAFMYFITLLSLVGVTLVRQFVQKQEISEFQDIAIIVTINSLFLISGLLYFGARPIQKLKIKFILLGYGLLVVLGSLFTYANYNIFLKLGLS
jgi:energy-converting hydrogenase Eha subunit G